METCRVKRVELRLWQLCSTLVAALLCPEAGHTNASDIGGLAPISAHRSSTSSQEEPLLDDADPQSTASCELQRSADLRNPYPQLGKLNHFIAELLKSLRQKNGEHLARHFHPRLNQDHHDAHKHLQIISSELVPRLEYSIYKLWAIANPKQAPQLVFCSDEKVSIIAIAGYKLQYGLMIQVSGQRELGRIFTHIVSHRASLKLGSFHFRRWTFQGLGMSAWKEKLHESKTIADRAKYLDIVSKLSSPNPLYEYNVWMTSAHASSLGG